MDYQHNKELFEKLRAITKEHNVVIWTAQQPQRKFSGYSREIRLSPYKGEGRNLGIFPMDHINLIIKLEKCFLTDLINN